MVSVTTKRRCLAKITLNFIMSRSSSRRRRPFSIFLALIVVFAGWLSNQFLDSSKNEKPNQTTVPKQTSRSEAGALQSDVVSRIADGDSLELKRGGRIRLVGVDCPELSQRGGREAAAFTRAALLGKTIEYRLCSEQPRDRYGRGLGFIYLRDKSGQTVPFNAELVKQGYARVYPSKECQVDMELWNTYYEEARLNRRGLFATLGEVPDARAYRRQNGRGR